MRNTNKSLIAVAFIALLSSCVTPVLKSVAYKKLYSEAPKTILIMPPINKSTNVEAKEYFHSTLSVPLANQGYYVIPPFLSMEILKKESAYNSELFVGNPLDKFGEIFGADAVLFTTIHKWSKNALLADVTVDVEYTLKSTKTNNVLYTRRGTIIYDASVNSGSNSAAGFATSLIASAIKTAATDYTMVARKCNVYTLSDLPTGKYHTKYKIDGKENAGPKTFRANVR